jgi:hypothetical protein
MQSAEPNNGRSVSFRTAEPIDAPSATVAYRAKKGSPASISWIVMLHCKEQQIDTNANHRSPKPKVH